jgi:hypothetical protein
MNVQLYPEGIERLIYLRLIYYVANSRQNPGPTP